MPAPPPAKGVAIGVAIGVAAAGVTWLGLELGLRLGLGLGLGLGFGFGLGLGLRLGLGPLTSERCIPSLLLTTYYSPLTTSLVTCLPRRGASRPNYTTHHLLLTTHYLLSYLLTSERCIPSRQNEIAPSPRHAASRNAASMEAASSRQMACPPSHRTWVVRVRVRVRIRVRVRG